MKKRIFQLAALTIAACMGGAHAATITVTSAASSGPGTLDAALTAVQSGPGTGDTINFAIPGPGPHYIIPPVGGFPIITKDNVTIDGYSQNQPGSVSSVNTSTILGANNAVIQIVIRGSDDGTDANRHFINLTDQAVSGFTDGEEAILACMANNFTVRGLCFEGDWANGAGQKLPPYGFESEYGIALGGNALAANCHISGCRFGLDPDNVTVRRLKDGIAWFGGGVDNLTIGVAAGPANAAAARAQFNIFVGMYISAIGDHGPVRICGNFFNVYPDGNHDYTVNTDDGSLDHSMEAFTEQNAAGTSILIGTDGDGINDAEERNIFGGVTQCGDSRILEWYSGAPTSYIIAGNYFGMGVDGVTRFTNGGPTMQLVETFKGPSTARFGSDFNGTSDALEGNVVSWNYPFDVLFPNPAAPGFSGKFRFANIDAGDVLSVRGNSFVGMQSPPYTYCWTAFGLANYSNRVAQFMVPAGDYNTFYPQVDVSSSSTNLIGTCPPGLSPYDGAIVIDVYKADPEGWANGKKLGLTPLVVNGVTNGFAEGKTYVGSLRDNGPYDLDPTVGSWRFNVGPGGANLGLAAGDFVTVTANYSDTPLTGTAVGATGAAVHTSNFSKPVTLQVPHRIILVTTTASSGVGSLTQAILDAAASADPMNTIAFSIPGTGPFHIAPPVGGFPLITRANTIIDGYSQPGASVNSAPITATNNAKIQIVLDAGNGNFRDMAYVYYGSSGGVSSPPIDNSSMANPSSTDPNTRERGGYDPAKNSNGLDAGSAPYAIGERAILGIYRATNVWVKGLALLSDGLANDYAIAVALDYGLDTSVRDRWDYPAGTCRGLHISGCWIGVDPVTGSMDKASSAALTAYRHRDKSTGGTRPDLSNMEDGIIGVAPGSANPRAEFNVLATIPGNNGYLGFEACRYRISGNQFLGADGTDLGGRVDDLQTVPAVIIGTDGDGVNDADEGNLWPEATLSLYHTANRYYVVAGNIFGLARDGSRPKTITFAVDSWDMNEQSRIRFGSDFNGVSDAFEANTLYDSLGFASTQNAPTNTAWVLQRGNVLVNNSLALPWDATLGLNLYNKYIDTTAANPITPAITAASATSLSGTCGIPLPSVAKVVVDIYAADPEGELLGVSQGKTYITSRVVASPSSGAFSFTGLTLPSGTKVTIAVNYLQSDVGPTITSVSHEAGSTSVAFRGGAAPYQILQASTVTGPYKLIATAAGSPATFADAATTASFYRIVDLGGGGQTSPFSASFLIP